MIRIRIAAAGYERVIKAQTEREAAVSAEFILRTLHRFHVPTRCWVECSDLPALHRVSGYLSDVANELATCP